MRSMAEHFGAGQQYEGNNYFTLEYDDGDIEFKVHIDLIRIPSQSERTEISISRSLAHAVKVGSASSSGVSSSGVCRRS